MRPARIARRCTRSSATAARCPRTTSPSSSPSCSRTSRTTSRTNHLFARLAALPGAPGKPDVWLLGSSPQSAIWAGELGLPYSVADFINPQGAENARLYRERFAPSRRRAQPETTVCVSAICAETDEEAQRLAASQRMAITLLRRGRLIAVPSVEKALAFLADAGIGEGSGGRRVVVGTPEAVRAGLERGGSGVRRRRGARRDDHARP